MSDEPNNLVLEHLRIIRAKIDNVDNRMTSIEENMIAMNQRMTAIDGNLVAINLRLDRVAVDIGQIKKRLG